MLNNDLENNKNDEQYEKIDDKLSQIIYYLRRIYNALLTFGVIFAILLIIKGWFF